MDLTLYMKIQGQQNNLTAAHQCGWLDLSSQSTKDASVEHLFLSTIWGTYGISGKKDITGAGGSLGGLLRAVASLWILGLCSLTMKKAFLYVPAPEDPLAPHLVFLTVVG